MCSSHILCSPPQTYLFYPGKPEAKFQVGSWQADSKAKVAIQKQAGFLFIQQHKTPSVKGEISVPATVTLADKAILSSLLLSGSNAGRSGAPRVMPQKREYQLPLALAKANSLIHKPEQAKRRNSHSHLCQGVYLPTGRSYICHLLHLDIQRWYIVPNIITNLYCGWRSAWCTWQMRKINGKILMPGFGKKQNKARKW